MVKNLFLFFLQCFVFKLIKSQVKTADEINEFNEYLKRSNSGKPRSPAISELKDLENEWERSGKFEGDILVTDEQREALVSEYSGARNALIATSRHWPEGIIFYQFDSSNLTTKEINSIRDGISDIEKLSCLRFKERINEENYILITNVDDGCFANVGMIGGAQTLNLGTAGCFRHGTIVHEFLHGVGFYHMHSTYDRDDWIKINWENIQEGYEHAFRKYDSNTVTNLGEEYDYKSCLHYSEYGFSFNGNKTIEPIKDTGGVVIGQRNGMSQSDINRLNRLYNCSGY